MEHMEQFQADTIYVAIAVLLPLVPALLLYWALPSKEGDAEVSGPLQGFTIKLQGAIAAYFAIFLFTAWIYPRPLYEPVKLYTLTGHLGMSDSTAAAMIRNWNDQEPRIKWIVEPELADIRPNGKFELKIPYSAKDAPFITIELGNCRAHFSTESLASNSSPLGIEDYGLVQSGARTIRAQKPILLKNDDAPFLDDASTNPCGVL